MPPALEDYTPTPQQEFYRQDYQDSMDQSHQLQQDVTPDKQASHQRVIKPVANPSIEGLAALPIVRASIPWRTGQELPPEKSVDSQRVQQRGAALLSLRGNVAQTPCVQCAAGNGRFSQCIVLQSWFQGACCSCTFTSKGNKCSFRHQGSAEIPTGGNTPSNPAISSGVDITKPQRKRGRPPKSAQMDSTFNSSPLGNQSNSNHHKSPDTDDMLQAQLENEGASHVEDRPPKKSKYTGNEYQDMGEDAKALLGHEPKQKQKREKLPAGHPAQDWKAAYSSRPNTGAADYYHQDTLLGSIPRASLSKPVSSKEAHVNATPVIDLLPKSKQRHIYGLISGLQGGIDHLQKQLNMLKNSLGIDIDDEDDNELA
ncbi:hypothetical protein BGZ60DRAFT_417937 [Tricladium varicosporioides]|nr:hypothetical protein BGZ60DRAFT_417937 [Hymenoscyphus varicosporioides]